MLLIGLLLRLDIAALLVDCGNFVEQLCLFFQENLRFTCFLGIIAQIM